MATRKSYCLLILLCYAFFGKAQGVVIPPSPNAASLGQYGDVPVGNYTGIPSISIPIYTIRSGEIELPISLGYHASGIKVAQEASLVGLGWSLNAGGVITRQVRGMDDFDVQRGYVSAALPPATENNLPDWSDPNNPSPNTDNFYTYYEIYQDIATGELDGEPDIFYYNFFGHSGKLLFEKQSGNDIRAISLDQNNFDFLYHKSTRTWEVTDGNGWKYFFGTSEETDNYTYSSTGPISLDILEDDVELDDVITAWYIDSVITPKGDEITFFYNEDAYYSTISQVSYSESLYRLIDIGFIEGSGNGYISPVFANHALYSANMQEVKEVYLNRIEFNNGTVIFSLEDREDMRPTHENGTKPQRLETIEVFDLNNESIKKIDFEYVYRSSRLMLESLQESFKVKGGTTYMDKPPYRFTYDRTALPAKNSYSVDHWGYYNARNNNYINKSSSAFFDIEEYLTPGRSLEITDESGQQSQNLIKSLVPYIEKLDGTPIFINGADREPNAGAMQAAILKSIQYPTGGISKFTYEPNDYYSETMPMYSKIKLSANSYDYGEIPEGKVRTPDPFTLSEETLVKISLRMENHLYTSGGNDIINLYEYTNVVLQREDAFWHDIVRLELEGNMEKFRSDIYVMLPAGEYRVFANNGDKEHLELGIRVEYSDMLLTTKKMGGGMRIKSIDTYEREDGPLSKRKVYDYTDDNDRSTGRVMSPVQYFYSENVLQGSYLINVGNIVHYVYSAGYIVSSSNTVVPLGTSAQGNFIGYDRVTVTDENEIGETLGATRFYYENEEEIPIESFVPGIPNSVNLGNGQLIKEEYFNTDDDLVKEKIITYQEDGMSKVNIKGVKFYSFYGSTTPGNEIRFYDVHAEWRYPAKDSTIVYDLDGNHPVTTVTDYEFNNASHKNLNKSTTTNSRGEVVVHAMEYPSDYPTGTTMATTDFDDMVEDNVLNTLIKTENTVDGIKTEGSINNFTKAVHTGENNVQNNMYLPKDMWSLKMGTTAEYETRLEFDLYDDNGKLLQMTRTDGIQTSYIWGYNGQYPMAKIENATHTVADNAISAALAPLMPTYTTTEALLASLGDIQADPGQQAVWKDFNTSLRESLPNSMVTTYTYDPLVGLTSVTDPRGNTLYYTYDSFTRLKMVRDADGNLVTDYEYHYADRP